MPREETWELRPHPLFLRSLNPMLIVDDERRYVDANPAACLFLRLPRDAICELRIDDVTPPELRPGPGCPVDRVLAGSGGARGRAGTGWEFQMPRPYGRCPTVRK